MQDLITQNNSSSKRQLNTMQRECAKKGTADVVGRLVNYARNCAAEIVDLDKRNPFE